MIRWLEADVWVNRVNESFEVEDPSREEALRRFEALDGKRCDSMTLEVDEDHFMGIGGGWEGEYIVTVVSERKSYVATGDGPRDAIVQLPVGGQDIPVPANRILDRDRTLKAMIHYFDHQERIPELSWEEEAFAPPSF